MNIRERLEAQTKKLQSLLYKIPSLDTQFRLYQSSALFKAGDRVTKNINFKINSRYKVNKISCFPLVSAIFPDGGDLTTGFLPSLWPSQYSPSDYTLDYGFFDIYFNCIETYLGESRKLFSSAIPSSFFYSPHVGTARENVFLSTEGMSFDCDWIMEAGSTLDIEITPSSGAGVYGHKVVFILSGEE